MHLYINTQKFCCIGSTLEIELYRKKNAQDNKLRKRLGTHSKQSIRFVQLWGENFHIINGYFLKSQRKKEKMSFSSDGLKEQTYSMQSCGRRAYYRSGSKARVAGVIELIKTHIDDGCCISKREREREGGCQHDIGNCTWWPLEFWGCYFRSATDTFGKRTRYTSQRVSFFLGRKKRNFGRLR